MEIKDLMNKVHHSDCMEFMGEMSDGCVNLTLTDIPYNECNKASGGLRILDKDYADRCDFDVVEFTREVKRITTGSIYIFCGIGQISSIYNELRADLATRLCHWHKRNPSPINGQHMWLSATENCLFAKKGGAVFNEHCKHNVWNFLAGRSKVHKTEKPPKLLSYLINTSSLKGDIVFDPCIGSGSTAIAAVYTQRRWIGVEKNPTVLSVCKENISRYGRDIYYEFGDDNDHK